MRYLFIIALFLFAVQPADAQLFRGRRGGSCSNGSCAAPAQVAAPCQPKAFPQTQEPPQIGTTQSFEVSQGRRHPIRTFIQNHRIFHRRGQ